MITPNFLLTFSTVHLLLGILVWFVAASSFYLFMEIGIIVEMYQIDSPSLQFAMLYMDRDFSGMVVR